MIERLETGSPKILGFKLSGTLHDEDYRTFVPAVEAAVEAEGTVRMLAIFERFHGWTLHAAWDDLKFGVSHTKGIERIAMVGDKAWQEWMARLSKPFTPATVKYFDATDIDAAWAWVREGDDEATP